MPVGIAAVIDGGAAGHNGVGGVPGAGADGRAVEGGPAAPLSGEQLAHKGVIHHAVLRLPVVDQGHGHAAAIHAAGEIGGAVDGVHHKNPGVGQSGPLPLLAEKLRLRQQLQQLLPQKHLHGLVILGHQVRRAVLLPGDVLNVVGGEDNVPRPAHNVDDLLQHT